MKKYDLTIIGGGSGGLTAARLASALGANVLLVDKERLGGDCLHYGCVPSKSLIHVARVVQQMKKASALGLTTPEIQVDMAKVAEYIRTVIARVEKNEQPYVEGVTVTFGKAEFVSTTELVVNSDSISSRNTLIATGSHPAIPEVEGLHETGYLTNEDVFDLTRLPVSMAIIGGGPVGVELAQALARLGVQMTLVQRADRILPKEDPDVSAAITEVLRAEGIRLLTRVQLVRATRQNGKKSITVRQGEQLQEIEVDELLLAVGRHPNVEGLNLEAANISYSHKAIHVNKYLQTSTPNILAIGDVIGEYLFTHVAAYQAGIAVRNALVPLSKKKVDYRVVPWCTFTDPEAARVGLTPKEAERQYKQVRTVKLPWTEIDRAQTEDETKGFLKLVLAGKKDRIVGVHMVGVAAGELLGELSLAMQKKLTIADILATIHAYPTMSTGIQQAAFTAYLEGKAAASNRKLVQTLLKLRR